MALVQEQIFDSPQDGTAFLIEYDDVTLLATRAIFVVPQTLGAPLTVNATNPQINGGQEVTWQAPPSHNNSQFTFSPQIQGVHDTFHGQPSPFVDFGFTKISFGTVGNNPDQGSTVIHVSQNS